MPFSFPLPNPDTSPDTVEAALAANESALGAAVAPIVNGVESVLATNGQSLAIPQARVTRAVNGKLAAAQKSNANVLQAVADQVQAAVAQSAAAAAATQGAAAGAIVPGNDWYGWCDNGTPVIRHGRPALGVPIGIGPTDEFTAKAWAHATPNPCAVPRKTGPPSAPAGAGAGGGGPPPPPVNQSQWKQLFAFNPTKWFAVCANPGDTPLRDTGANLLALGQSITARTGLIPFTPILGPFDTDEEAQAAPLPCDPSGPPPPPPPPPPPFLPPPPPPPFLPPPPPPVGPPTWSGAGWYSWCDEAGKVQDAYYGSQLDWMLDTARVHQPVNGPFPDEASALAGAPPCQPPPPPPPPVSMCPWTIGQTLPTIGGEAWCAQQPQITAALAALGNAVVSRVLGWAQQAIGDMSAGQTGTVYNIVTAGIAPLVNSVLAVLTNAGIDLVARVRDLVVCWQELVKLSPACNPATMLGVVILRGVVRLLKRARLGTDLGVWATIDLSLDIPAIERACDYIIEAACPSVIPTAAEAYHTWRAGYVSEGIWQCWARSHGHDPDIWENVYEARGHVVGAREVILAGRLSGWNSQAIDAALAVRGWTRDEDRGVIQGLYDRQPAPARWLAWAAQDVLDPAYVAMMQLDTGFADFWNSAAGLSIDAQGFTQAEALNDWRLNWRDASPGQLQQWLHRLRGVAPGDPGYFGVDTYRRLLEAANYPPPMVAWTMATAYRPVDLGQAQIGARLRTGLTVTATNALLDAGYDPLDVPYLARAADVLNARTAARETGGWTIRTAALSLFTNQIDAPGALGLLVGQGYTADDVDAAWTVLSMQEQARARRMAMRRARSALVRSALAAYSAGIVTDAQATAALAPAGYDPASAATILGAQDLADHAKAVVSATRLMKRGFLRGEFSAADVLGMLTNAGVSMAAAQALEAQWAIEQAASAPMASVSDLAKWVASGLLSPADATLRLANMGWRDPDLTLQIATMSNALAAAQAKAARGTAAGLAAAKKAATQVAAQAERALQRVQPLGSLKEWYQQGIMSATDVSARMAQYGYDPESISLYLRGWTAQAAQRALSGAGKQPGAPMPAQKQVPLGRVKAWYIDGIVDRAWVKSRLTSYEYDGATIDNYLTEWDAIAGYRAAKTKPPAPL